MPRVFAASVAALTVLLSGTERPDARQVVPAPLDSAPLSVPPAVSPRNASYRIKVKLDSESRTLTGHEFVTWRNLTSRATAELRFHLYYNAWRNTQSTWMREWQLGRDEAALRARGRDDWGWSDVRAIRSLGAGAATPVDLMPARRFIAPDDGNQEDRTVLAVTLPQPAAPGSTVNLEIEWTAHVPRTFARTGAVGDYFFIAQWFPKVAVLEDHGWVSHQFHAGTEFYADYGTYDVEITVPVGWVVGATGRRRGSPVENPDRKTATHQFYQEDVHDFAWTTSPYYVERTSRFEHPRLPAVDMRLLLQPEHVGQAERHFAATRAALRHYGEWFGPYPYGHITVIDPAWQSGAGGMEYPTLFTAGSRWLAPSQVTQPEGVTVHEAGHQFWYGIVGNNEFEHAWLDEGLNTFSTARTIEQLFPVHHHSDRFFGGFIPWAYPDVVLSRATDGNRLHRFRPAAKMDAQSTPSYQYWPPTGARITYDKTALWLHTLERHLGWPVLQRIMSTFFHRWQFKHPKPADFFAVANEVSGQDLTWFFDQVHRSSNVFDYGVQELRSVPAATAGYVERDGRLEFVPETGQRDRYVTTVVVRRFGEAIFPVDVQVTFEDGEKVRERWDGRERWRMYTYEGPQRAVHAQVDPERVLLLDLNYTNNSRSLRPAGPAAAEKWSLKWLVWLEDLLLDYAFFV